MDGKSFDRLSVAVHRLRDTPTRRQALRALAAGGAAGVLVGVGAGETGAACTKLRKKCDRDGGCCGSFVVCDELSSSCDKNGDRCCGWTGADCDSKCDCCDGFKCGSNGRCQFKDDDNNGQTCGIMTCRDDWNCCHANTFDACYDPDSLRCCSNSICPKGWDCCGSTCCTNGWKCCGHDRCCPDGWNCGQTACFTNQSGDRSAASEQTVPFKDAVAPDDKKWIRKGRLEVAPKRGSA
jgi:hypothetical protein